MFGRDRHTRRLDHIKLPRPAYLRAWNDVERHFSEFKVDLIDLGVVSDRLRQRVEEQGVDL